MKIYVRLYSWGFEFKFHVRSNKMHAFKYKLTCVEKEGEKERVERGQARVNGIYGTVKILIRLVT